MRYVAIALLILTSRILTHDHHWETVELCGSMLTLACAYAVLTGGRGICRLLRDRLHVTSAWTTPAWCRRISGHDRLGYGVGTDGRCCSESARRASQPTDEMSDITYEPDGDDGDFGPSEQNFNGGISADARTVLQSIGESVLNLVE